MKPVYAILLMILMSSAVWAADVDLYVTDCTGRQIVGEETVLGGQKTNTVSIFGAPGEYEPFSFALQPKERITEVMIDDLKYLWKLQQLVDQAKSHGQTRPETEEATSFLKALEDSIIPNWTAYSQGGMKWPADGMEELDSDKAAEIGSLNTLRRAVADHIVRLQRALSSS